MTPGGSGIAVGAGRFEGRVTGTTSGIIHHGVRVNSVSPGYVATPFLEADVSLSLLPDEAGYRHGPDLLIDGGYSLR